MKQQSLRAVCAAQGAYFLGTGIWPLVHMESFEKVTGLKVDKWLVKTVGVLVSVIGAALLSASRNEIDRETVGLATGAAAGLAAIDCIYAVRGRISSVYFADAAIEAALVAMWLGMSVARPRSAE